jgi:hypothetical protein
MGLFSARADVRYAGIKLNPSVAAADFLMESRREQWCVRFIFIL